MNERRAYPSSHTIRTRTRTRTRHPSSPNSLVNRSCSSKSPAATVGRARASTFLKSFAEIGGGCTLSPSPSCRGGLISKASDVELKGVEVCRD